MRLSLVLLLALLFLSPALAAVNISSCGAGSVISAPGVYTVNASLSGAPNAASTGNACIVIGTDDVIVDCQGNSISHDDSANTEGIIVNATASPLSNITIRNCRIRDYASGVYVEDPAGGRNAVTLTNNTISSNTYGVRIPGVWADVVMVGNLVANNTNSGYFMDDYFGGTIDMTLDRFLGNTADINYTTGMSGFTMDIADVIFGNADGTYGANTTVSHSSSSRSWGMIDWVPAPAAPSANHVSFLNKSVNMTPDYIDLNGDKLFTVTMKWTNAEGVSALQESAIQLWLTNDSGNHLLNSSPDISNNEISASIYLDDSANSSVFSLYRNNGCPIITSPGAYVLDRELSGAPNGGSNGRDACVLIDTDDVVFDCAGHNITHDDSGNNAGIMVNGTTSNRDNITIKNCNVLDYEAGILVDSISSNRQTVNLSNNTLTSNAYGISVPLGYAYVYGRNNLVANNTAGGVYDSSYFGDILDFSQDRFLGNVNDFDYPSGGSGFTLNLVDIILGNPDGSYFANLTLNHTTNDNTWGIIDYVFPPTHPSPAISSFLNKSFNITHDYLVTFGFDDEFGIKLKWGASEGTALQQGFIQMWLFNESGPFLLNGTPDTVNREISVQNYLLNDISNSTVIGLYLDHGCPVVNSPGSYSQSGNFFGAPNVINGVQNVCLLINASNVDWDCSGNTIINDGTDTSFGVYVNGPVSNITIRNCPNVSGYVYGAYVYNSTGVSVRNVTAGGSFQSAFASPYSPVLFDNDTAYGSGNGFYVTTGNNVTNCAAAGNNYGYYLDGPLSTGIRFINDTAALSGNYGFFSTSGANGNYFSLNRAFNSTNDGFYINSNGNNLSNNTAYYNGNAGFSVSGTGNMVDNNSVYNNTEGIRLNAGPNTAFNNDVQDNPGFGFISTGNGNNITGNRGVRNGYGVDVSSCSGNVIASNNFSSGTTGIAVIASTSTSISGNNVFGNSQEGFYLSNSNGTAISNDHVYANLYAFYIQGTAAAASVNLSNVIIDRAAGDFANYTNLSLNDSVSAGSAYRINWTVNSSSPGAAYTSLLGKMVSIGTVSGGVSLDNIVWHYLESDIGALDEDSFVIMKYNGSWSDTGAALDTGANTLALLSMVPSSDYGIFEGFACPVIAAPGTFIQGQDYLGAPNPISGGYACVVIDSDDVAYDCNGFNITNNGTGGTTHGIAFNTSRSNVTIRNCPAISGYTNGLSAQSASNSRIYNSTFFNNSLYGVIVNGGSNVNITNTTSRDNSNSGYFLVSTTNSVLRNNTAYGHPSYGVILQSGSSGNTLDNNTAHSNLIGFGSLIGSNGNAFMNGTAYNNSNSGFYIDTSNNTQLAGNSAYDNAHGFQLTTASGSSLTGNIVRDNTQNGLFVVTSTATNLSNNTIYNNAAAGTFLSVSSGTIIRLDHYYNNGLDLRASAGGSASQLNLSSVIFDSASGTYLNYTNLSINDSIEPSAAYSVDWSPVPAMPDAFHTPFAGKFVNISVISGTPGIDSIFWTWLPSEVTAQYNESMFELWKYNSSGWAMLNTSPDMGAHSLSLYNMNPASVYGILNATENCPVITTPGTYQMSNNYIGAPNAATPLPYAACVVIASPDVVFDCNGFSITNNGTTGIPKGIFVNVSATNNVTVKNCPGVSGYHDGIFAYQSMNTVFQNVTAFNNTYGIRTESNTGSVISSGTAYDNSEVGIDLFNSSRARVTDSIAYDNAIYGFMVTTGSSYNNISDSTAYGNGDSGFYLTGSSNYNNLSGNNASNNPAGYSINSGTQNLLAGNLAYNNSNTGIRLNGGSDSNTLVANTVTWNYQYGIFVNSNYNILQGNIATYNSLIGGAYSAIVMNAGSSNLLVGNTANDNFADGIFIYTANNTLANNTAFRNRNGFIVAFGNGNNLTGNTAYNNSAGFYVTSGATNNRLIGNTAYINQVGFNLASVTNNVLENNTAYTHASDGIMLASSGSNNVTGNVLYLNTNNGISMYPSSSNNRIIGNNAYDNGQWGFYAYSASNSNLFANNTVTANSQGGLYMNRVAGNNLTGNTIRGWSNYGILLSGANNTLLANNSIDSLWNGIWITNGTNNALSSNTAYNNSQRGVNIQGADGTAISNDHYYGNGADFQINGTGITVNLSGVSFDNPAGDYTNYTNLSLNDLVSEAYLIRWIDNSTALPLPVTTTSFRQKFVSIEDLAGNATIDSIVWSWLDSELANYTESNFAIYEYDGIWTITSATLSTAANTLSLANVNGFSVFAILQYAPSTGGEPSEEPSEEGYDVSIKPACQGFIVTVKDGGTPVANALVTGTDETDAIELTPRYTNSSGQAFFPDCDIDVSVKAAKSGRQGTDSGMAACGFCPECATDDDCADSEQCSSQQCVPVNCPGGRVVNHACELFECMEDSDCPVGQSCIDHSCKTVYECTYGLANTTADDNADCADNEYCDVPVGQPGGSCKPITGCGDIRNHAITLWECGDLEGCPACNAGELCITHNCVQGDITCPASGIVGDSKTCQAKEDGLPCLNCDYVVTDPAGKNFTGKTDDKGNLNLPLKLAGNYKVTLLRDGEVVKTILVKALPKSPPVEPEKPASGAIDPLFAGLFLIILLALGLVAIMYWRRGKGEKKKQAPPKK